MSAHTPGPWHVEPGGDNIIRGPNGECVCADGSGAFIAIVNDEDARRIVTCVNACEGILTEALEAEPGQRLVKYLSDRKANHLVASLEIGKLTAQRDALLAALKLIRNGSVQPATVAAFAADILSKATGPDTQFTTSYRSGVVCPRCNTTLHPADFKTATCDRCGYPADTPTTGSEG
jgi:hypothetical protein